MKERKGWYTAKDLGLTAEGARRLAEKHGSTVQTKQGRRWLISREELETLRSTTPRSRKTDSQ